MPQRHTAPTSPTPSSLRQALGWVPPREAASGVGVSIDGGPNPVITSDTQGALDAISSAQGTLLYRGASAWVGLAPGTSGLFLKTLGASANPAWAAPADHGITQLTGDVTAGPGDGSQAATLANSGVTAATYGDSTHVAQVAFDVKGRATGASAVAIAFPAPAIPSVTFGVGAPVGTPATGALYFDTTLAVYVGYVGNGGVWNQF